MKNKNIKNKPKKCGRWLFLHSRFSKIFRARTRRPPYKGNTSIKPSKSFFNNSSSQRQKQQSRKKTPPLKQSTRNLSLGYTEIEKKEEGTGAKSFLCDL